MAGSKGNRRKKAGKHKARQNLKERASDFSESSDQLFEEITALSAIFQDDFNLISEHPVAEFSIHIRPHSVDDNGIEENISAELVVRCVPGYPQRPPKLHVVSKKGLSEEQSQSLHTMLVEQAASLAREGRVMVFNLMEAAQEFLSESSLTLHEVETPQGLLTPAPAEDESWGNSGPVAPAYGDLGEAVSEDWVFFDLFSQGCGESDSHWDESPEMGAGPTHMRVSAKSSTLLEEVHIKEKANKDLGRVVSLGGMQKGLTAKQKAGKSKGPSVGEVLSIVEEVEEQETKVAQSSSVSEILQRVRSGLFRMGLAVKQTVLSERSSNSSKDLEHVSISTSDSDEDEKDSDSSSENETPMLTEPQDAVTQSIQKDLVLGHLLRLVCGPRGLLPDALPVLATQLQKLGVLPQWAKDLLTHQPDVFDAAFHRSFAHQAIDTSSETSAQPSVTKFWNATAELMGEGEGASSKSNSRYLTDFEELSLLGEGGFGHVVLCKNKLDGRRYAMKKILLKDKTLSQNNKILRLRHHLYSTLAVKGIEEEVATLSRLQHHHVVRYYQAWIETGMGRVLGKLDGDLGEIGSEGAWLSSGKGSMPDEEMATSSFKNKGDSGSLQATYLYIQMEYCPRTLREVFNSYESTLDKEATWDIFRQIVEGLAHIHGQGILHRDLTPNNIFMSNGNDIKIGDFGLAKFTNLEQPDLDPNPSASADVTSGSLDGTGQVGTYFYTAPEIAQGWPHIDEKVDMYSLGVVLFELWYQFNTGMERVMLLNELKQKGTLPATWTEEFVAQAALVRWLTAPHPSDRPSAVQVLRSELLPPCMQHEALNDILRTIQSAEDTTVYDQVVATIFDDERVTANAERISRGGTKLKSTLSSVKVIGVQDRVLDCVKDIFMRHGAIPIECTSISLLDNPHQLNRLAVRLVDQSGNMLHLCYDTRQHFAYWVALNQPASLKRYQIDRVYRRGISHSAPREYFQGDFDIVGGAHALAEAEAIKVAAEVVAKFPVLELYEVRLNHRHILAAIWAWAGVKQADRRSVAQLLAVMGGAAPRSSARKALWPLVRRQLLQDLQVAESVVDRLQTVERRLSGNADDALARLRGALPPCASTSTAIDELSMLLSYMRVWDLDKLVTIDALMPPTADYFDGIYFQVHVQKANLNLSTHDMIRPVCLAVGGRYDNLLNKYWAPTAGLNLPGAVGLSIGLQKLIYAATAERKQEATVEVLVCSRGGGGLLVERMQVVAELWAANIKAEYVCAPAPSLTEQYEYAHEHGIKWLVIITEAGLSLTGNVKVRHLELKAEEEVPREDLVKYFIDNTLTPAHMRKRISNLRLGS